ncbi:MAG: hypothetical protein AYP45_02250 [Candidatus Brocadia carolinensis]|uniref:Uncharacterized protein n=1 Tax=Candidatus Brocadia carolinensis TaxID=1004156 RepID=A0A1V4AWY9_9BACT|nr:MAG: hypothetical protein AYP45_02250 [Candidatus Brocadia caroliniensis]
MILPLKQSNALTDFMMDLYVNRVFGVFIVWPDAANRTLEEFADYVLKLKERVNETEFENVRPQLKDQYEKLIKAPHRNGEDIIVPTGSLFIETLPATTSLIERFKAVHRAVDAKKAQAEVRKAEMENLRLAARLLNAEREDPDVEKKIVVEGSGVIVNPDPN